MTSSSQNDVFKHNIFFWKIFGLWPGKVQIKYYKYYSFAYLFVTFIVYNILLTLNLIYTPRKIEYLIREVIFYFTEIAVTAKVAMILVMRCKILDAFKLVDCEEFQGDNEKSSNIIEKTKGIYKLGWKFYVVLSNFAYSSQVLGPLVVYMIWKTKLELPICKYYFLSEEVRQGYFTYWFIYQSFGMYGHMMYNVNIDSFIAGILMMAVAQMKALSAELKNCKDDTQINNNNVYIQDKMQIKRLNKCLMHYDLILQYCSIIQDFISVAMFVQFGMASIIICIVMYVLTMPLQTETLVFMVIYLFVMTLQIFMPAWLGTQLKYEGQNLAFAAYSCEWIPRSAAFKKSIIIFMTRANVPIQFTALSIFPLSLDTFTSIMKTAYSLFALIRNVEDN